MAIPTRYRQYFKPAAASVVPMMLQGRGAVKRSYTAVASTRTRQAKRSKSLKTLINNTKPAKHLTGDNNRALTHNTIYTMVPSQAIQQSVSGEGRIGDDTYLCALKLTGHFLSHTTAGAYSYRVIVGWSGEELTTAGIATSLQAGLGITELFLPGTAGTWTGNGVINPKAFTVLHDSIYDINSQIAGTADLTTFNITVPINYDFKYQSAGSVQGKTRNLCVVVIGGVAFGTTGTTAAGNCIFAYDLIHKD